MSLPAEQRVDEKKTMKKMVVVRVEELLMCIAVGIGLIVGLIAIVVMWIQNGNPWEISKWLLTSLSLVSLYGWEKWCDNVLERSR